VALYDADTAALDRARAVIDARLPDLEQHGLADAETVRANIVYVDDLAAALDGVLHVQENVFETVPVKQAVFAELDRLAAPECVLASSSSGITASQFTEALAGRQRCLVAHPLNPPYLTPLVELVPAPWTDASAVERTRAIMQAVGQVPILVKREVQGFIVNRLQGALLNEALRLVEDGSADPEAIDKAVCEGLGLRWSFMGPFETIDLNAPGGLADYAERYGPLYADIARSRGQPRPWASELVEKLHAARRERLPAADLEQRQAWRDRRMMALAAHKLAQSKDS
jgi:3-hydroxyacyl-CoA dehydrogenase